MIVLDEPLYFEASRLVKVLTDQRISKALANRNPTTYISFLQYKETICTMEAQSKRVAYDCLSLIFSHIRIRWTLSCIALKTTAYLSSAEECAILNEGLSGFPYQYAYTAREGLKGLISIKRRGSDDLLSGWILLKQSVFSQSLFEEDTCRQMKL